MPFKSIIIISLMLSAWSFAQDYVISLGADLYLPVLAESHECEAERSFGFLTDLQETIERLYSANGGFLIERCYVFRDIHDTEARYRLAAQQVMANDVEHAVDNLLIIMQKDRGFGDDAGRVALLKLFDMLGEDPAVSRYRARLFNLLH